MSEFDRRLREELEVRNQRDREKIQKEKDEKKRNEELSLKLDQVQRRKKEEYQVVLRRLKATLVDLDARSILQSFHSSGVAEDTIRRNNTSVSRISHSMGEYQDGDFDSSAFCVGLELKYEYKWKSGYSSGSGQYEDRYPSGGTTQNEKTIYGIYAFQERINQQRNPVSNFMIDWELSQISVGPNSSRLLNTDKHKGVYRAHFFLIDENLSMREQRSRLESACLGWLR